MSKFLKFIVNLFLTLAIIVTAGIIVPPLLGVNTTIVDTASMDTNLPLGSVTYSRNTPVLELEAGDEILKESGTSTYAYIVQEGSSNPDITILASGSEVNMALDAAKLVSGKTVRVVSVPDLKKFSELSKADKDSIIGNTKRIVCTEAGISMEWLQFTSKENCFCIDRFGESGPAKKVAEDMGFTAEELAKLLNK